MTGYLSYRALLTNSIQRAFGKALAPLHKLSFLHLGVYLSSNQLFENHLDHAGDFNFPPNIMTALPFGPDCCVACNPLGGEPRRLELVAAAVLAEHLPALERVTWSTWFAENEYGDNQREKSTTVWTLAGDEGIAARRMPW